MKFKSMIAAVLTVVFLLTVLTGCGGSMHEGKDGVSKLADAEDAAKEIVEVNRDTITVSDLQYYIYSAAMNLIYQENPNFSGDVSDIKWEKKTDSGKTLQEEVLEDAIHTAIADVVAVQQSAGVSLSFSEDDRTQMQELIDNYIEANGEEQFLLNLQAMGIDSKEEYEKIFERVTVVQKIQEDLRKNIGRYVPTVEVLKPYQNTKEVSVQHVLILSENSKFENPKATAEEVLKKAKKGTPFADLIARYNEDPGATEAGYTFGRGEMESAFEEASFALDFEEISDIVQTSYGYHIIRRVVSITEAQEYWIAESVINRKEGIIKKISVPDVVNAIVDAQKKLQEQYNQTEEQTEGVENNG